MWSRRGGRVDNEMLCSEGFFPCTSNVAVDAGGGSIIATDFVVPSSMGISSLIILSTFRLETNSG